jgi:hypothetical protein
MHSEPYALFVSPGAVNAPLGLHGAASSSTSWMGGRTRARPWRPAPPRRSFPMTPCGHQSTTMLRVQQRRRPEDWDKRQESLSGRFLPLDPGDEALLDELERTGADAADGGLSFGPDGPPLAAYGTSATGPTWSKRADAAKKRWADPVYRANMLAKRAEKKLRDIQAGLIPDPETKRKVHIGRLDSITLSSEEKAKAINAYARSNKKRSEKITAYHFDRAAWMAKRLSSGEESRLKSSQVDYKKDRQLKRQAAARKRHAQQRLAKEASPDGAGDQNETLNSQQTQPAGPSVLADNAILID